jgi:hypothetical protein
MPAQTPANAIIRDLYGKGSGPLATRLNAILAPSGEDDYARLARERLTQQVRQSYGARGLAGSGIAIGGERDALTDFNATLEAQKVQQALNIFGGSQSPTIIPGAVKGSTGGGLFGK